MVSEIGARCWTGKQGAAAAMIGKSSQRYTRVNVGGSPRHEGSAGQWGMSLLWRTDLNPGS
jgi:hypothetical protein